MMYFWYLAIVFVVIEVLPFSYQSKAVDYRHQGIGFNDENIDNVQSEEGIFHSNLIIDFIIVLCLTCGKSILSVIYRNDIYLAAIDWLVELTQFFRFSILGSDHAINRVLCKHISCWNLLCLRWNIQWSMENVLSAEYD